MLLNLLPRCHFLKLQIQEQDPSSADGPEPAERGRRAFYVRTGKDGSDQGGGKQLDVAVRQPVCRREHKPDRTAPCTPPVRLPDRTVRSRIEQFCVPQLVAKDIFVACLVDHRLRSSYLLLIS